MAPAVSVAVRAKCCASNSATRHPGASQLLPGEDVRSKRHVAVLFGLQATVDSLDLNFTRESSRRTTTAVTGNCSTSKLKRQSPRRTPGPILIYPGN